MNDDQVSLIAERLAHALDLVKAELRETRQELEHMRALSDHRLGALEEATHDHELRLRANTEGVTQFKQWAGLASGGSSILALIALIRAFFGG